MALYIAGIDEAGYGPLLGPMCVGMTCLRIEDWQPGDAAPNVWTLLSDCITRHGRKNSTKRPRLLVDDSKKIKLANSTPTESGRHPLMHLERGVMAFAACLPADDTAPQQEPASLTDDSLLAILGVSWPTQPWYAGEPCPLPLSWSPPEAAIAANRVRKSMSDAGVSVAGMRTRVIPECEFNRLVAERGSKAATTEAALAAHLRWAWDRWSHECIDEHGGGGPRILCDAHGGRTQYAEMLSRAVPGEFGVREVVILEESPKRSRYELRGTGREGQPRAMTVQFMPEADGSHFTVALASMAAKLVRELLMARFNRYWCARMPELKPTAGYNTDARRWLADAAQVIAGDERSMMVRRA